MANRFHMFYRNLFLLIFPILTSGLDVLAVPAQPDTTATVCSPKPLTLGEVLSEAEASNYSLQALRHEALAKQANIEPQGALEDPSLSLELSDYSIAHPNPRDSADAGNRLTLRQKIPFPGKRSKLIEIAKADFAASAQTTEQRKRELISQLKQGYADLAFAHAEESLVDEQLKLLQSLIDTTTNSFSLGKASQADVLSLQVESARLLERRLKILSKLEKARAILNQLMGRDPASCWRPEQLKPLHESLLNLKLSEAVELEKGLSAAMIATNPSLKSFELQHQAAATMEDYAKLERYPDFEVMAGYNWRVSSVDNASDDQVSLGVGVTIPLWRNTKQERLVQKATEEKIRNKHLWTDAQTKLIQELHTVLVELRESKARLDLNEHSTLPLSRAAIASAEKSYAAGESSLSTALELIKIRFEAELTWHETVAEEHQRWATLERLVGDGLLPVPPIAGVEKNK